MLDFNRHPDRYTHIKLAFTGEIARLDLAIKADQPYREGYDLKLNSYDLGVDLELADAVQRIRFEHPEVKVVVISSALERAFSAGANIKMLQSSSHPFKVNFCKFTNETRCGIEDASKNSGIKFIAALNGIAAGGGYELAITCDEIYLVDDGNSAVSLPEVALLGVLPGTGGLTRLVDKRKVRRDHADLFSTLVEGVKGKRAKQWNLIDDTWPKSAFAQKVDERAKQLAAKLAARGAKGIPLDPVNGVEEKGQAGVTTIRYRHVTLAVDEPKRTATLTVTGPTTKQPKTAAEFEAAGGDAWALRAFREIDDAVLQLRFGFEQVGIVVLETKGSMDAVLDAEKALLANQSSWLCREILFHMARVLRRYELTARSLFALVAPGSCFAGSLFELALAGDRIYMHEDDQTEVAVGPLSAGALPMSNGLTRLESRFLAKPEHAHRLAKDLPRVTGRAADELGLVTVLADEIDWADTVRIAIQERASLSPDALTGMEASLRFGGAETCDSKIYGRLSAWQNWIFTRPNATGEHGALVSYGKPTPPSFDWRRT